MNCDDAFDLMTDMQQCRDPRLATHLRACARCREMQATLSPVLEWLTETPMADEPEVERATNGRPLLLTAQALQLAEQATRRLPRRQQPRVAWLRQLLTITIVAIGGVAAGAFAIERAPGREQPAVLASDQLLTACLWNTPGKRDDLPDQTVRGVVASCILCHVPTSVK